MVSEATDYLAASVRTRLAHPSYILARRTMDDRCRLPSIVYCLPSAPSKSLDLNLQQLHRLIRLGGGAGDGQAFACLPVV
jgi:hypothetical protein